MPRFHAALFLSLPLVCALAQPLWSAPAAPEALEEGEVSEYVSAPDTAREAPPPPRVRSHRLAFLNLGTLAAAQSSTLPLSLEYEHLGEGSSAWFVGASYALEAGGGDLQTGLAFGRRWYFSRGHAGPFLGLSPAFAIGPDQGPILLALVASGGYVKTLGASPWYLSAQGGIGPGVYWYESPRYDPGTGKSETKTGAIVVGLGLALGVRF